MDIRVNFPIRSTEATPVSLSESRLTVTSSKGRERTLSLSNVLVQQSINKSEAVALVEATESGTQTIQLVRITSRKPRDGAGFILSEILLDNVNTIIANNLGNSTKESEALTPSPLTLPPAASVFSLHMGPTNITAASNTATALSGSSSQASHSSSYSWGISAVAHPSRNDSVQPYSPTSNKRPNSTFLPKKPNTEAGIVIVRHLFGQRECVVVALRIKIFNGNDGESTTKTSVVSSPTTNTSRMASTFAGKLDTTRRTITSTEMEDFIDEASPSDPQQATNLNLLSCTTQEIMSDSGSFTQSVSGNDRSFVGVTLAILEDSERDETDGRSSRIASTNSDNKERFSYICAVAVGMTTIETVSVAKASNNTERSASEALAALGLKLKKGGGEGIAFGSKKQREKQAADEDSKKRQEQSDSVRCCQLSINSAMCTVTPSRLAEANNSPSSATITFAAAASPTPLTRTVVMLPNQPEASGGGNNSCTFCSPAYSSTSPSSDPLKWVVQCTAPRKVGSSSSLWGFDVLGAPVYPPSSQRGAPAANNFGGKCHQCGGVFGDKSKAGNIMLVSKGLASPGMVGRIAVTYNHQLQLQRFADNTKPSSPTTTTTPTNPKAQTMENSSPANACSLDATEKIPHVCSYDLISYEHEQNAPHYFGRFSTENTQSFFHRRWDGIVGSGGAAQGYSVPSGGTGTILPHLGELMPYDDSIIQCNKRRQAQRQQQQQRNNSLASIDKLISNEPLMGILHVPLPAHIVESSSSDTPSSMASQTSSSPPPTLMILILPSMLVAVDGRFSGGRCVIGTLPLSIPSSSFGFVGDGSASVLNDREATEVRISQALNAARLGDYSAVDRAKQSTSNYQFSKEVIISGSVLAAKGSEKTSSFEPLAVPFIIKMVPSEEMAGAVRITQFESLGVLSSSAPAVPMLTDQPQIGSISQVSGSLVTTTPTVEVVALSLAHTPTTPSLSRVLAKLFDGPSSMSSTPTADTTTPSEPIISLVATATSDGAVKLGDIGGNDESFSKVGNRWITVGNHNQNNEVLTNLYISIENAPASSSSAAAKQQRSGTATPPKSSSGSLAATVACCLGYKSGLVEIYEVLFHDVSNPNAAQGDMVVSTLRYRRKLHNGPVTSFFHVNHIMRVKGLASLYQQSSGTNVNNPSNYNYNIDNGGDMDTDSAQHLPGAPSSAAQITSCATAAASSLLSELDFRIVSVSASGGTICLHRSSDYHRFGLVHGSIPSSDESNFGGLDCVSGVYMDAESEYCLVTMRKGRAYLWQLLTGILERVYQTPTDYINTIDPTANLLQTSLLEEERSLPIFANSSPSSSTTPSLSLSVTKFVEMLRVELAEGNKQQQQHSTLFTPTVIRGMRIMRQSLMSIASSCDVGVAFKNDLNFVLAHFLGGGGSSASPPQEAPAKPTAIEVLFCITVLSEVEKNCSNSLVSEATTRLLKSFVKDVAWASPPEAAHHSSTPDDTDNFDCYSALATNVINILGEMVPLLLGVEGGGAAVGPKSRCNTSSNSMSNPLLAGAATVISSALAHISNGPFCPRCKLNLRKVATQQAGGGGANKSTYGRGSIVINGLDGPKHLLFEVFVSMIFDPASCTPPTIFTAPTAAQPQQPSFTNVGRLLATDSERSGGGGGGATATSQQTPNNNSSLALSNVSMAPSSTSPFLPQVAAIDQSAYMFLLSTITCTLLVPANDKQSRLTHDAVLEIEQKVVSYLQVSTTAAPSGNNAILCSVLQLLSDNWLLIRPHLKNAELFLKGLVVFGCLRDATAPVVKSASLKAISTCFLSQLRAGNRNFFNSSAFSNGSSASNAGTPTASANALTPSSARQGESATMSTKEDVVISNELWSMLKSWFSTTTTAFHPELLWKGSLSATPISESSAASMARKLKECSGTHRLLLINCFSKMIQSDPVDILVNDGMAKILSLIWIAIDPHSPSRLEREACYPAVATLFRAAVKHLPFFSFQQKFQRIAIGHNTGHITVFDVKSADELTKFAAFEAKGVSAKVLSSAVPTLFSATNPLPPNAVAAIAYSNISHDIAVLPWDLSSVRIYHASGSSTFFIPSSYSHFKLRKEVLIPSPAGRQLTASLLPQQAIDRCTLVWLSPHCVEVSSPWHDKIQVTV